MSRFIFAAIGLTILLSAIWLIDAAFSLPIALFFKSSPLEQWSPAVHRSTNAYFSWRIDPVLSLIPKQIELVRDAAQLVTLYLSSGVLLIGLFSLFTLDNPSPLAMPKAALAATLTSLILVLLFGWDELVLGAIAWWPLMIAVLVRTKSITAPALPAILSSVTAGGIFAAAANQYALPLAALAVLISSKMRLEREASHKGAYYSACFAVLLLSTLALINVPAPAVPDYPPLSHVVPDDDLPGNIVPLVGPVSVIPIIERAAEKSLYYGPAIWLAFLALPLLALRGPRRSEASLAGVAALMIAALIWDTLPPESISQIGPLQVIHRVVPKLFFLPSAPMALAVSLLLVSLILVRRNLHLVLCIVLLPFVTNLARLNWDGVRFSPGAVQTKGTPLIDEISRLHVSGAVDGGQYRELLQRIASPSYTLLRNEGVFTLIDRDFIRDAHFVPCSEFNLSLQASHNSLNAYEAVCDARKSTRWSPGKGHQEGDEFIDIRFEDSPQLRGIELATGDFTSDFPRGVKVSCETVCAGNQNSPCFNTVREIPSYQGAIHYTSDGYPYYGGQNEVKIYFKEPISCKKIRVSQIGVTNSFDWSIAALRFLPSGQH
ncbi:MAG: hypothetical protein J5J00_13845 [Deltaproteobacteria bacterium]|nr:hypothetical protein [Deltaproteobacteria bacterium]